MGHSRPLKPELVAVVFSSRQYLPTSKAITAKGSFLIAFPIIIKTVRKFSDSQNIQKANQ